MKNLILLAISLATFNSYADQGFDQMSIQEIYDRGYMLEATVTRDLGIRFTEGRQVTVIGNGCHIKLKEIASQDSILRKGTKISFEKLTKGYLENNYDGLTSVSSKSIDEIDYQASKGHRGSTLAKVKEWCDAFHFEVVENVSLLILE